MDLFYVPPLQRPDECQALEENYMNCMVQKSMKDRVLTNRCVLDSILWFHLECPKAASKFDDPVEFKRKFRNWFAYQRASAELVFRKTDEMKALDKEFGHARYPEDIKSSQVIKTFKDEFKQIDPWRNPGDMTVGEWSDPINENPHEPKSWKENHYDNAIADFDLHDITAADSAKFGNAEPI